MRSRLCAWPALALIIAHVGGEVPHAIDDVAERLAQGFDASHAQVHLLGGTGDQALDLGC